MALNFPNTPTNAQSYVDPNGHTWVYEITTNSWTAQGAPVAGMVYMGSINITTAPPTGATTGSVFTVSTGGTPNAGFHGLPTTVAVGSQVIYDGAKWQLMSSLAPDATESVKGIVELANAAENAAGTDATKAVTPAFSVPKNASGMTGAAILPSGTNAQRAAITTPVVGMQRFNTDSGYEEVYTGSTDGWLSLAFAAVHPQTNDLTYSANTTLSSGTYVCRNLTINAGVTVTSGSQGLVFLCSGTATIDGNITASGGGPNGGGGSTATAFANGNGPGGGSGNSSGRIYPPNVFAPGSGGSSGYADSSLGGSVSSGNGGAGGGTIIVSATQDIKQGAASVLSANGGKGGPPLNGKAPFRVSGSGGGSGGSVILKSASNITVAGTISVIGGNGGIAAANGGGVGGDGADGGGGGGGGVVVLQAGGTLTNTASIRLAGGTPGSNVAGRSPLAGGGGASFGGSGGSRNTAGSVGLLLLAGSPV